MRPDEDALIGALHRNEPGWSAAYAAYLASGGYARQVSAVTGADCLRCRLAGGCSALPLSAVLHLMMALDMALDGTRCVQLTLDCAC